MRYNNEKELQKEVPMRKSILIALVLLLSISFAFASDNAVGVMVFPRWDWPLEGNGSSSFSLGILAEGSNYLGKKGGGFGVEYGLGATIPTEDYEDACFLFNGGLGYKHLFSKTFALVGGLGVFGNYLIQDSFSVFRLDLYGRLGITLDVADSFGINAGVLAGGNVMTKLTVKLGEMGSGSGSGKGDTFFLAPYVGASYLY